MVALRRSRWLAIGLVGALALAACGSDDDSGADTTAATAETSGADTTGAGGETTAADGAVDFSESQATVDALLADPTTVGVTEPLSEPPPADAKIIWLQCSVPECVAFGDGVEAGAEAAGWEFSRINFELTPESAQAAFTQALGESPDAIMSVAIDPTWISEQRQQAIDQGVAFFDCCSMYESDPETANGGYGGVEAPPTGLLEGPDRVRSQGSQMADYAIVQTDGEVNALTVYIPDFPIGIVQASGFADRLAEVCPDTCKASPVEIAIEDIGTNAPSMIVSELQRDPSINYVMFISGSFATGVDAAIVEAGLQDQVRIVGNNPIPASFEDMLAGDIEQAWMGLSSSVVGWRYVDMAIRHLQGIEIPEKATGPDDTGPSAWSPIQLLTPENYPEPVPFNRPDDHPEIFSELWLLNN